MRRPVIIAALAIFIFTLMFVLVVNGSPRNGFDLMGFWFAWYAFHPETEVFVAER